MICRIARQQFKEGYRPLYYKFRKGIYKANEDNEIILLCNGMLHDSFLFKNEFGGYQELVSIRLWNAVPEVSRLYSENTSRAEAAEKIREDYIAS